jgi:hypothetical protein
MTDLSDLSLKSCRLLAAWFPEGEDEAHLCNSVTVYSIDLMIDLTTCPEGGDECG